MAGNILTRLVREECANFVPSPSLPHCSGLTVRNQTFRDPGDCWLFKNKPCDYFRDCVLPAFKGKEEWNKVAELYYGLDPVSQPKKMRRCECGTALEKKKKYCQKCRKKKQREASREKMRKSRSQC